MPSDPNIPLNPMPGRGSPAAPLPIPSFGMLARGSMLQRMKSNFAECITAAPRGIPPWQFAVMFRSAYIPKRFPTRPLLQSIFLHVCVLTFWISLPTAPDRRRTADEIETARAENRLIYYTPTDRLPPVSPLEPEPQPPQPQSPRVRLRMARGPERVVSRPPRPDNSRQTIVQPEAPHGKLPTDVEIPNLVAWQPVPPPPSPSVSIAQPQLAQIPAPRVPAPAVPAPVPVPPKLTMPVISVPAALSAGLDAPVPPPPSPSVSIRQPQRAQIRGPRVPALAVPSPTPAPPKLTLPEAGVPAAPSAGLPHAPPPPPPSVSEGRQQLAQLRVPRMPNLVAVGVAPAPAPVEIKIPLGNRSGEFAVSPDGGQLSAEPSGQSAEGDTREAPSLPQFAKVGEAADIRVPNLSIAEDRADLPPPPVPVVSEVPEPRMETQVEPQVEPRSAISPLARPAGDLRTLMARAARSSFPEMTRGKSIDTLPEVFGERRIYTVYINMPKLASGAGSWILRFAERDGDGSGGNGGGDEEISSPVAVKKVDPKYAPEAARERVEGTVTLAAEILRSGKVTSVKVVQGLDPRLDLSAVQALTLWQFEPARKKGVPIDLEVLVQIPFRLPAL